MLFYRVAFDLQPIFNMLVGNLHEHLGGWPEDLDPRKSSTLTRKNVAHANLFSSSLFTYLISETNHSAGKKDVLSKWFISNKRH